MLCIATACKRGRPRPNNGPLATTTCANAITASSPILPLLVTICELMSHLVYLLIRVGLAILWCSILKLAIIVIWLAAFMEQPIVVRGSFAVEAAWHVPQVALHSQITSWAWIKEQLSSTCICADALSDVFILGQLQSISAILRQTMLTFLLLIAVSLSSLANLEENIILVSIGICTCLAQALRND